MVVGIGVPRPVGFERTGGLAALGVAQIGGDDAVAVLELVERVERMGLQPLDRRVQAAARNDQQRKTGAGLLVMDADIGFFVERHGVPPSFGAPCSGRHAGGRRRSVGYCAAAASLSCVFVSKSLASWRSCSCSEGSPAVRLTIRPRLTAGRAWIWSAQRLTCLYS